MLTFKEFKKKYEEKKKKCRWISNFEVENLYTLYCETYKENKLFSYFDEHLIEGYIQIFVYRLLRNYYEFFKDFYEKGELILDQKAKRNIEKEYEILVKNIIEFTKIETETTFHFIWNEKVDFCKEVEKIEKIYVEIKKSLKRLNKVMENAKIIKKKSTRKSEKVL